MRVRDRLLPKNTYKGRLTEASDAACPCRPCYNAHDCGYIHSTGRWVRRMYCATNWNNGCPSPKPAPEHVMISRRARTCKRCGAHLTKEQVCDAMLLEEAEKDATV
jgi:hypothetical protein